MPHKCGRGVVWQALFVLVELSLLRWRWVKGEGVGNEGWAVNATLPQCMRHTRLIEERRGRGMRSPCYKQCRRRAVYASEMGGRIRKGKADERELRELGRAALAFQAPSNTSNFKFVWRISGTVPFRTQAASPQVSWPALVFLLNGSLNRWYSVVLIHTHTTQCRFRLKLPRPSLVKWLVEHSPVPGWSLSRASTWMRRRREWLPARGWGAWEAWWWGRECSRWRINIRVILLSPPPHLSANPSQRVLHATRAALRHPQHSTPCPSAHTTRPSRPTHPAVLIREAACVRSTPREGEVHKTSRPMDAVINTHGIEYLLLAHVREHPHARSATGPCKQTRKRGDAPISPLSPVATRRGYISNDAQPPHDSAAATDPTRVQSRTLRSGDAIAMHPYASNIPKRVTGPKKALHPQHTHESPVDVVAPASLRASKTIAPSTEVNTTFRRAGGGGRRALKSMTARTCTVRPRRAAWGAASSAWGGGGCAVGGDRSGAGGMEIGVGIEEIRREARAGGKMISTRVAGEDATRYMAREGVIFTRARRPRYRRYISVGGKHIAPLWKRQR
ncbi:hypothetical protein C8J57DRAFT_1595326 [Mycena rebaudengoi]|nr:hypothetical protein C8J57DRAFT_1595326 [Mycena rebaudengoi]